ncbi:MAG: CDP-alcohol phosphatidyltransferase family protein [Alphaproteobacteria bacterium]|nr:CDP-alcohol phosphatidyltransferase family protein [Alphaproteobacteria bacterium]
MNVMLRQTPNILSTLRLVAAPIAALLILRGIAMAALFVFALAGLSDALDGFLAKRFGLSSRFGAWLDPAADKLLMLASFLALTEVGVVPGWFTVLVIGRDVAIVVGVLLARGLGAPLRVEPLIIGKASTVVQVSYVALLLLLLALNTTMPRLETAVGLVVAVFTLLSFLAYARVWLQAVLAGQRAA